MTPLVAALMAFTFTVQTITTRTQLVAHRNLRITDHLLASLEREYEPDAPPRKPLAGRFTHGYLIVMSVLLPFLAIVFASAAVTGWVAQ